MLRPTASVTRLAIRQANKVDFSGSVSEGLIEHPPIVTGKEVFPSGCRSQLLRHDVLTPGALLDPKELLPSIFAGEVYGLFDEFLLHHWQVDF